MIKDSLTCDHGGDGWPALERLTPPHDRHFKCSLCGALAYVKIKGTFGRGRNLKNRIAFFRCRVKGCKNPVIERRYTTQCRPNNGCVDHPLES
jgi:hypothetical protein